MKKIYQGFSLLELMIVVAIMSVLATISVPLYRDHLSRSKIQELLLVAESVKLNVAETMMLGDQLETEVLDSVSKYVSSVKVTGTTIDDATIEVLGNLKALGIPKKDGHDLVLKFIASLNSSLGIITWKCVAPAVYSNFIPKTCEKDS